MFVNFKKLFGEIEEKRSYDFSFDFSGEDFIGYTVSKPVEGTISFTFAESALIMRLSAKAVISYSCAKCLDAAEKTVEISRTVTVRENCLYDEEEALPVDENGNLDVKELVYTELVLEVPPVLLCSEDCKGLCPVCGKKREEGCTCGTQSGDERFAVLKQLLS